VHNPLRTVRSFVDWLRGGYPDGAPHIGHSPLIALNGPMSLSQNQTQEVLNQLGPYPCDEADVKVAITKVTDRLPNPSQVQKVAGVLETTNDTRGRLRLFLPDHGCEPGRKVRQPRSTGTSTSAPRR
jgi:hypothetical protein